MSAYTRLTRLPEPEFDLVDVTTWVERVVGLETRLPVSVSPGPTIVVRADGVQLDQLLINLIANAVDAVIDSDGSVEVGWRRVDNGTSALELWVDDDGPGLPDSPHLFVPFFTTKPHGSGIGLVLSRQIAEAHRGTLTLENRPDVGHGCRARLVLPIE
jgi:signal transduction histidine kinase